MLRKLSAMKVQPVNEVVTEARDIVVIVPLSRLSEEAIRDKLLQHLKITFPHYRFSITSPDTIR